MENPNQRASRRRRDRRQNTRAAYDTSSVIRLAGDRRMPPSPQGEGLGESLTACVPAEAGQEAGSLSFERCGGESRFAGTSSGASRHLPRARGRLWRIPTSVRPGGGGTRGRIPEQLMTPHPSSALRGNGGCHLPLKGKALANPNQRASRRSRDKGLDPSSLALLRMTDKSGATTGETGIRRVSPSRSRASSVSFLDSPL